MHTLTHPIDWAARNCLMCDFVHRGIVPPPPPRRGATKSTVARPEPGIVPAVRGERSSPRSSDWR